MYKDNQHLGQKSTSGVACQFVQDPTRTHLAFLGTEFRPRKTRPVPVMEMPERREPRLNNWLVPHGYRMAESRQRALPGWGHSQRLKADYRSDKETGKGEDIGRNDDGWLGPIGPIEGPRKKGPFRKRLAWTDPDEFCILYPLNSCFDQAWQKKAWCSKKSSLFKSMRSKHHM